MDDPHGILEPKKAEKKEEPPKFVVIESPFLGGLAIAVQYARLCVLDSLRRGEVPLASHLLYPQILDDHDPKSREIGMRAGWAAFHIPACRSYVYTDLGISRGMHQGIEEAVRKHSILVGYRSFGPLVLAALDDLRGKADVQKDLADIYKLSGEAKFAVSWP